MEVFGAVLTVCKTLHTLGEAAKADREECHRLAGLATMVEPVVRKLRMKHGQDFELDSDLGLYLNRLKEALMVAQEFVEKKQSSFVWKMSQRRDKVNQIISQIHDTLNSERMICVQFSLSNNKCLIFHECWRIGDSLYSVEKYD